MKGAECLATVVSSWGIPRFRMTRTANQEPMTSQGRRHENRLTVRSAG
ncbi:Uncharacterised protein [Mycobacteroides abscessus subsp. abscessus]|nr:Uncharacterised protein [Mycobacteroides abscessus subsp. abscessus]